MPNAIFSCIVILQSLRCLSGQIQSMNFSFQIRLPPSSVSIGVLPSICSAQYV